MLSDIYIKNADKAKNRDEVLDLMADMQIDYATRMRELRKEDTVSIHVRRSIEYIYENLSKQITVNELAERAGLSLGYFSRLFNKETGKNVNQFINQTKIRTAKNMLKYSDYSLLDISLSLGFSSQSAFTAMFKKFTGVTPKGYRDGYSGKKMREA